MLDVPQLVTPAAEIPKVGYLTFGSWLFLPEDATRVEDYDFGVFAGGDDPFAATSLQGLAGTATYAGKAAGTYAETIHPQTESFTADVALTADFGSASDLGRITGAVSNFQLASGKSAPVSTLRLQTDEWEGPEASNIRSAWNPDDAPVPGGIIEGETIADEGWWGTWGGRFFGNGKAATDLPTDFAGTFGATDGTRSVAGSFGAHVQP